jgi:glycosyltransferase involved in cell wall biosynthesis
VSVVLAVVVPTRNRASLAIQAIQSILAEREGDVRILVSDNSSKAEEIERLAGFCATRNDGRLVYLRAPESMPMGTHWDWAITQALRTFDATHVTVHYDRKVTRPGELALLCRVAAQHPEMVITFGWDAILSYEGPPRHQIFYAVTDGRLYELASTRVLAALAAGHMGNLPRAIPLLNNCVVPREMLLGIIERFGGICDSLAADVSFTFRFLGMYDRYLYLSRGFGVLHSFDRSHAAGFLTGKANDMADLRAMWGDRPWLDAAPIPGLNVGQNMVFHEYVLAQRVFGAERFPPIDMDGYLRELGGALGLIADPAAREEIRATLERHGWKASPERRLTLRRIAKSIHYRGGRLWHRLAKAAGVRSGRLTGVPFASEAEALQHAIAMRGRHVRHCPVMRQLHAREVAGVA